MELKDLRKEIDKIDDELVKLFTQRMEVSAQIAGYKKEKSLPIFVPAREREKLADVPGLVFLGKGDGHKTAVCFCDGAVAKGQQRDEQQNC